MGSSSNISMYNFYFRSFRIPFMNSSWINPQSHIALNTGSNDFPCLDKEYSTFGGFRDKQHE